MPDYRKKIDKLVEKWQKGQFKNKMKKWEKNEKITHLTAWVRVPKLS